MTWPACQQSTAGHRRGRQPQGRPRRRRRGPGRPGAGDHLGANHHPRLGAAAALGDPAGCGAALWDRGHGQLRAGLSRWLQQQGYQVVEVNRPTAKPAGGGASPTRWTPRPPPGPCWPARPPPPPRPPTAPWRCCGCCGWPAARRSRPAPRPPTSSQPAGDRPRPAAPAAARAARPGWSTPRPPSARAADQPAGGDQVRPAGARPAATSS